MITNNPVQECERCLSQLQAGNTPHIPQQDNGHRLCPGEGIPDGKENDDLDQFPHQPG